MAYGYVVDGVRYRFGDLKTLLAKASPARSGDMLAGLAAGSAVERIAAQEALSEVPLKAFLNEALIPYEDDEVTRLIVDGHDEAAFAPVSHMTVGEFRNWLLSYEVDAPVLRALAPGLTPEMAAAVSKIMGLQDLILVASKCEVISRFRNTIGLTGRMSTRLQPNHPTDDVRGVAASTLDGLLNGSGDAVIGINPASDHLPTLTQLLQLIDEIRETYSIPTQSCVL
ncbi:MAG: ethanolamine ammonia-lyase subunit EutB, partial [Gammaproteobacteria bacterium]